MQVDTHKNRPLCNYFFLRYEWMLTFSTTESGKDSAIKTMFMCTQQVSEMLKDKEICVINGSTKHPKADLEKKVLECGGTIVQHPG